MRTVLAVVLSVVMIPVGGVAQVEASRVDGGSVITDLGFNIRINAESALNRTWVVLNDPSSPVSLEGVGVSTIYEDRAYRYQPSGVITTSEAITAVQIRVVLYDVFGNHIKTLTGTEVRDLPLGSELAASDIGTWRAFEPEVIRFLTAVSFVAGVRTASGAVWRYDEDAIVDQLRRIDLETGQGLLAESEGGR
jgi:hypothetical protein